MTAGCSSSQAAGRCSVSGSPLTAVCWAVTLQAARNLCPQPVRLPADPQMPLQSIPKLRRYCVESRTGRYVVLYVRECATVGRAGPDQHPFAGTIP